jgi:hypothetical protein
VEENARDWLTISYSLNYTKEMVEIEADQGSENEKKNNFC